MINITYITYLNSFQLVRSTKYFMDLLINGGADILEQCFLGESENLKCSPFIRFYDTIP